MTVNELHIDFDTKLNRLSGSSYLGFSEEEKDWYLNEAVYQKIFKTLNRKRTKVQEDFADTKENISDLEELLTTVDLPLYKVKDNQGLSILPPDFLHLIETNASLNNSCSFTAAETSVKAIKYFKVDLVYDVLLTAWTASVVIGGVTTTLFTLANVQNIGSVVSADSNFYFVNRVLDYVNSQGVVTAYWENYDSLYKKNSFFFVYTGVLSFATASVTANASTTTPTIVSYNKDLIVYTKPTSLVNCRLESNEMRSAMAKSPFYKSSKNSPIVLLFNGALLLQITNFNPNGLTVNYIRKPKVIDYFTKQSLELGSRIGTNYKIAQEIVDIAVANAAARLGNQNFQILQAQSE